MSQVPFGPGSLADEPAVRKPVGPKVPKPEIPEIFPGFGSLVKQEELRRAEAVARTDANSTTRANLAKALLAPGVSEESIVSGQIQLMMQTPGLIPQSILPGRVSPAGERQALAAREAHENLLRETELAVAVDLQIIREADFRLRVLQIVPATFASRTINITTVEDVVNLMTSDVMFEEGLEPLPLSDEDTAFVQNVLDRLLPELQEFRQISAEGITTEVIVPVDSEAIFADIQRKKGGKIISSRDLSSMTTDSILETIKINARHTLLPGTTIKDYMDAFAEEGLNQEQIDEQVNVNAQIAEMVDAARKSQAAYTQLAFDGANLANGKLQSQIDAALWGEAIQRPLVTLMQPFVYYHKNVVSPLGGGVLIGRANLRNYLGHETEQDRRLRDAFTKGQAVGNNWSALANVREEWDANGVSKFVLDVLVDPLSYFGFGWYAKPFRAIPLVGRHASGAIGAVETGYLQMADIPFQVLKDTWVAAVPRTLNLRATTHSMAAFNSWRAYLQETTGKRLIRTEPDEIVRHLTAAIDYAIANPQSPDARPGLFLLGDREIPVAELQTFLDTLGMGARVTPEMLDNVSNITALTDGFGATKFLHTNEAGALILRALNLPNTPENFTKAVGLVTSLSGGIRTRAVNSLKGETTLQILINAQRSIKDNWLASQHSIIANRRFQQGTIAHALDGLDKYTRMVFMNGIDKFITTPFARAYLLFGAYVPFNVVEVGVKTASAGLLPIYKSRRLLYRRNEIKFHGITASVPIEAITPQKLILSAQFPDESFHNLSPGVSRTLTREQYRAAQADTSNFMTQALTGRWMKGLTSLIPGVEEGIPLSTMVGFDWGQAIGGVLKGNYIGRMYDKLLREEAPDAIIAVVNIVDNLMPRRELEALVGKKYVESYQQEAVVRLLTGNLELTGDMVFDFAPSTLRSAEVNQLIEPLTEIYDDVYDLLMRKAETGELWAAGPHGIEDLIDNVLKERIFARYLESPEAFRIRFSDFADDLIRWQPTTPAELNFKVNTINQIIELYGETIELAVNTARIYGENQTNPIIKEEFYNNFWATRLSPHINQSADDITRIVDDLKITLSSRTLAAHMNLTDIQLQQYNQLLQHQLEVLAFTKNARIQQRALEQQLLTATPPGQRDEQWWSRFYYERSIPWEGSQTEFMNVRSRVTELSVQIEGLVAPFKIESRLTQGVLVPKDIADLFGVAPNELARNMYLPELLALRSKKSFVELVRSRANLAGKNAGKTADELGYTEAKISDIYDVLVREVKSDPNVRAGIEPSLNQLEGLKHELILLGGNRKVLVSDDTTDYLTNLFKGREEVSEPVFAAEKKLQTHVATQEDVDEVLQRFLDGFRKDKIARDEAAELAKNEGIALPHRYRERKSWMDPEAPFIPATDATLRQNLKVEFQLKRGVDVDNLIAGESQVTGAPVRYDETGGTTAEGVPMFSDDVDPIKAEIIQAARDTAPDLEDVVHDWFTIIDNDDLQKLGQMAAGKQLYRARIHAILNKQYPGGFLRIFRGKSGSQDAIGDRVYVNVSSDRETAGLFEAKRWGGPDFDDALDVPLDIQDIIIRTDDVVAIGSVEESELIISASVLLDRIKNRIEIPQRVIQPAQESRFSTFLRENPDSPDVQVLSTIMDDTGKSTPEWLARRNSTMDETNRRYGHDFPDYDNATAFTMLMKAIFPFWTYEAHRPFYLAREFTRHPGVYTGFGKYRDNTDQGYVHIPGTSLDINPLRGTILMGGMRRAYNRDYPEFYDQFGGVAAAFDEVSRVGFYPGVVIGATFATFGAKTGVTQYGEITPSWMRTMTGGLAAIAPGSNLDNFSKHIFPDRYRDFMTAREVGRLGGSGTLMLENKMRNRELSSEDQALWDSASRGIGFFTMLAEQTSLFRFRPQELIEVRQAATELLSELTGVPVSILNDLDKKGLRFEDVYEPLPPHIQKAVFEVDGFRRFTGGNIALIPSQLGQRVLIQREFWQNVQNRRDQFKADALQFEKELRLGQRSMQDWLVYRNNNVRELINFIENQKQLPQYREIPFSIDDRVKFAQENKMLIPILSPMETLRELYFSEPLEEAMNYETGQIGPDWDSFFAFRNAIEQALPDDILAELIDLNQRDSTSLEITHYEINRTLFRPYHALFDIVLEDFPLDEQALILEHRDTYTERAQEIQEIVSKAEGADGAQIVSLFSTRLRQAHSNLRELNPELDAWLNIFREVRGFKTEIAKTRTKAIRQEIGLPN